jgi:hypothetical protein
VDLLSLFSCFRIQFSLSKRCMTYGGVERTVVVVKRKLLPTRAVGRW